MITPEQQKQIQDSLGNNSLSTEEPQGAGGWYASLKAKNNSTQVETPVESENPVTSVIKGLVTNPATMLARPFQAAQSAGQVMGSNTDELSRISAEGTAGTQKLIDLMHAKQSRGEDTSHIRKTLADIQSTPDYAADELSAQGNYKPSSGGIIAPAPENFGDVKKDAGRAVGTVAIGLGNPLAAGAALGLGNSLEQGNDVMSMETLKQTLGGAATAKVLSLVGQPIFNAAGKVIGKYTPEFIQNIASQGTKAIQDFAESHDIPFMPDAVSKGINKAAGVVDAGGQAVSDLIDKPFIATNNAIKNVATGGGTSQKGAQDMLKTEIEKIAKKYPATVGATLDDMVRQNGTDPVGVLSSYGKNALPTLNDRGAIDSTEAMAFLKNRIGELSNVKNEALFLNDNTITSQEFEKYANDLVDNQGWSKGRSDSTKAALAKEFKKSVSGSYGESPISMTELDKLKTEQTALSKAYNNSSAKPFELDAHGIAGKAARDLVELHSDDAPTKELNKLIQSHYDAADLLEKMQGKAPHGGLLSKMAGRLTGEIAGATAGTVVGHPFVGAMAGRAGADAISGVLNNQFISNPLKRNIINGMDTIEPAVKKQMLDYIDANMPDISELGDSTLKNTSKKLSK